MIPSYLDDKINSIDSSKDGKWLLVTCDKYLMQFPTQDDNKSAWKDTLLKTNKPKPFVLRVDPRTMAQHQISEMKFLSARFDFKNNGVENHIVASSGPFMCIWDMKNILNNNYVTNHVKKLGSEIVSNQFVNNSNDLLTAFKKGVFIQPTQETKNRFI